MVFPHSNLRSIVSSALAIGLVSSAASATTAPIVTSIEIDNDTASVAALNGKVSITGVAKPAFPSSIAISGRYVGVTTTPSASDVGTFTYGPCEFHYSTILNTNPSTGATNWTFSQSVLIGGATICKAVATSEDYTDGTHSVQFIITK